MKADAQPTEPLRRPREFFSKLVCRRPDSWPASASPLWWLWGLRREVKVDLYRKEQFLVILSEPVDLWPLGPSWAAIRGWASQRGKGHMRLKQQTSMDTFTSAYLFPQHLRKRPLTQGWGLVSILLLQHQGSWVWGPMWAERGKGGGRIAHITNSGRLPKLWTEDAACWCGP